MEIPVRRGRLKIEKRGLEKEVGRKSIKIRVFFAWKEEVIWNSHFI